jgi:hypothetical protein
MVYNANIGRGRGLFGIIGASWGLSGASPRTIRMECLTLAVPFLGVGIAMLEDIRGGSGTVNEKQTHITVAQRCDGISAIVAISITCRATESLVSASPRAIRMEYPAVVVPSFWKSMAMLDEEI